MFLDYRCPFPLRFTVISLPLRTARLLTCFATSDQRFWMAVRRYSAREHHDSKYFAPVSPHLFIIYCSGAGASPLPQHSHPQRRQHAPVSASPDTWLYTLSPHARFEFVPVSSIKITESFSKPAEPRCVAVRRQAAGQEPDSPSPDTSTPCYATSSSESTCVCCSCRSQASISYS